jgi:hypothetical protein
MTIQVFGIRHHGPGCARSLRGALDNLRPDVIVMEGPADAEEATLLSADPAMKPPVALLVYPQDEPGRAAFFPFALFSPEWQTLQWGFKNKVSVRLMDLPQAHYFALDKVEPAAPIDQTPDSAGEPTSPSSHDDQVDEPSGGDGETHARKPGSDEPQPEAAPTWRTDPIALLAEAAGFRDHELWWELQVERRCNVTDLFAGILDAMRTVRESIPDVRDRDLLREAHMRRTIRRAASDGFQKIAVVCGAWHAPVLDEEAILGKSGCTVKDDDARLKGLPKQKTTATWIPWTYSRLSYRSGYGAGIESPGWYAHLWESQERAGMRWIATAARLLRASDLDASSAGVIEAIRLADALAALRELQAPGLAELNEAILSVLCRGDQSPMRLIRNRLEIGDVIGEVPEKTPAVPLAQDLSRLQKSLRLKPSSEIRTLDLDLRNEIDRGRSHLLHRLAVLNIFWGRLTRSGGRTSTFHEIWQIEWTPELAVAVIEANIWGTTIESAAAAKAVHEANSATDLAPITALLDAAVLAGLESAIDPLLNRIQSQAAVAADVRHLMDALLPLARVSRYGDVRGTQAAQVEPILVGLFERAVVGLPAACASLDDEAAERMLQSVGRVQEALDVAVRDDLQREWQQALRSLVAGSVHPLLRGSCCRLLLEKHAIGDDDLDRFARLELSHANPPSHGAAWLTGLLRGSGLVLLHLDSLWHVFDRWLNGLSAEAFIETLPLLRRAFADFSAPELRQMGEKVKRLEDDGRDKTTRPHERQSDGARINVERARRALPLLATILGVPVPKDPSDAANGEVSR